MIPLEIEHKFLVNADKLDLSKEKIMEVIELVQGYTKDGVRFTQMTKRSNPLKTLYKMCYKSGEGLVRQEAQCEIPKEVFDLIWPLTLGKRVTKTRYLLDYSTFQFEVDFYKACKQHPLVTAEIEFTSREDAANFDDDLLPIWVIARITNDAAFLNINLAC
ncbi:MAG TPA: hypothetical protein VK141_05250 [Nitrosomonas sp.]|nr:hypothetical protein [Nitrosomonas sp.]